MSTGSSWRWVGYKFPNTTMKTRAKRTLSRAARSMEVRGRTSRFLRVVQAGWRTNRRMVWGGEASWYWTPVGGESLGIFGDEGRSKRRDRRTKEKKKNYAEGTEVTEGHREETENTDCV